MNKITQKIMLTCAFIFSLSSIVFTVIIFKKQQISTTRDIARTVSPIAKTKKEVERAPSRIISETTNRTWVDVQKQVKDTVVQVFSSVDELNWLEPYKTPRQKLSTGSGFFINSKGDLISNYHVVAEANNIEIQIPAFGLERFDVSIVGVAPERDIALLTLTKKSRERILKKLDQIPSLKLGNSDRILRSQEVLTLGYPLGQSRLKSTLGIVSGRERFKSFIQISAPLNPGNSGGPALDTNGEVIGINSAGILEAQNVGYIIPINEVKKALTSLYKIKLLRKPTLGCIFTAATPELVKYLGNPPKGGWYIAKVFEGTLLAKVGVKDGDMLCQINGYDVDLYGDLDVPWSEDKTSLSEFLSRLAIGDTIKFDIYRKGTRKTFNFKFEPTYIPPVRMIYPEFERKHTDYEVVGGATIMQLALNHISSLIAQSPDLMRYGKVEKQQKPALVITHVLPNSQAFKTRILKPGETIKEVNGEEVKTLDKLRQAILKSGQSGYLTIKTDNNYYGVMSLKKILAEEPLLASRYFFKKSTLLKNLEKKLTDNQGGVPGWMGKKEKLGSTT